MADEYNYTTFTASEAAGKSRTAASSASSIGCRPYLPAFRLPAGNAAKPCDSAGRPRRNRLRSPPIDAAVRDLGRLRAM